MPETYNEEAIQQILKFAMSRQGRSSELTRSQLKEIADELGISSDNLAAAEQDWDHHCRVRRDRRAFDVYRHFRLRQEIVRCLVFSTILVLANMMTSYTISWSVYPVLIWSCILSLQAWRTYQKDGEAYDREFRRWKLGQQIGESVRAITERINKVLSDSSSQSIRYQHNHNHNSSNEVESP